MKKIIEIGSKYPKSYPKFFVINALKLNTSTHRVLFL